MIPEKYQYRLQKKIRKYFPTEKIFIFGSSARSNIFRDIDVAIIDPSSEKKVFDLQESFDESTFPYIVDIVNFSKVSKDFSDFVLSHEKKVWI